MRKVFITWAGQATPQEVRRKTSVSSTYSGDSRGSLFCACAVILVPDFTPSGTCPLYDCTYTAVLCYNIRDSILLTRYFCVSYKCYCTSFRMQKLEEERRGSVFITRVYYRE